MTRAHVTLLGPCYKTGQVDSYHYTTDYRPHIMRTRNSQPDKPEPSFGLTEQAHNDQTRTRRPAMHAHALAAISDILHSTNAVS